MRFNDFFTKELRDNGSYQFLLESDLVYKFKRNNKCNSEPIHVGKWRFKRDDDGLGQKLSSLSFLINEKLKDPKFIKKNLHLFNAEEYEQSTGLSFFDFMPGFDVGLNKAAISTGNLVGYVSKKYGNETFTIVISSRFGDSFLKHLVASTDGFLEVPESGSESTKGLAEWLLVFLWKTKLKSAYRLGLPKTYISKREKEVGIRGTFNLNSNIINRDFIPPYVCDFREHSYDNEVTRLVSNTFRFMSNKQLVADCHRIRQDFFLATNGARVPVAELLGFKNQISNPYYSKYNEVVELSKKIIRKELLDFAAEDEDLSAFLFDISMLFEFFIRKVLINKGYSVRKKNEKGLQIPSAGVYNAGKRNLYPDIIINNDDGSLSLYDVKYKRFDSIYGLAREDLFQLNTYLGQILNTNEVKKCGFIFPIEGDRKDGRTITSEIKFGGKTLPFEVVFFKVPKDGVANYTEAFNKNIQSFFQINND